ncbi:GbsR/MarR family transcriptional regulator [Actinokineospora pegani]|uniref:GbsR/MarR family transcriptional regulator n=1 Tax=Actinokineospora pegani TaxID=2654637 RepID=UPI001F3CCF06|nr:MarR family transcriptional regulator [Actinokineospora pegani]
MTDDSVARFVERLALLLSDAGMARMPARVFVRLLVTDSGKLTAPELAALLQVSPAAISGAVRYLDQVNLVTKGRDPGERRDHYEVTDTTWIEAIANRDKLLTGWITTMVEGVDVLGEDTEAGKRMTNSVRFLEFMQRELEALITRWREQSKA